MFGELEWLIGLLPFGFIALLLWMRLRVGGATAFQAFLAIGQVTLLVLLTIYGFVAAAGGWRSKDRVRLGLGATVAFAGFLFLQHRLRCLWVQLPVSLADEGEGDESAESS